MVAPVDDDRLSFLEVGARDFDQAPVRRLGLRVKHDRLAVADDVQDRSLAQVEDGISRDLETALRSSTMIDTRTDCPIVSRPSGLSTRTRIGRLPVCGSATRPTNATLPAMPCSPPVEESGTGARASPGKMRAACPRRTDWADRGGSQTDAKTCRESTTSPIGLPMAIVWPGWQCRLSSTPSIGDADGMVVEMSLGEGDQRVGRLDLTLGLGDRLGAGADHHHLELGLGRLLLDRGLLERILRDEELLLGDLGSGARKRTEPVDGLLGLGHRQLGLLDRQLVGPPLLGAGDRLEQSQRGLEPVPARGLLREIGLRDRRSSSTIGCPFFTTVAFRDQ